MPGARTNPRRAPDPAERQRDADRTRQRIVDAALTEFAEKGFAGARVRAIAARAGVNSQLISYYFGGKDGLYQEVLRRWYQRESQIEGNGLNLGETMVAYLEAGYDEPELLRIFLWQGLAGGAPPEDLPDGAEPPEVTDFRARQRAGEIAPDLDPAYLLVALMGAVAAPATMPDTVVRVCGVPADSPEFRAKYAELLRRVAAHLAGPRSGRERRSRGTPAKTPTPARRRAKS